MQMSKVSNFSDITKLTKQWWWWWHFNKIVSRELLVNFHIQTRIVVKNDLE